MPAATSRKRPSMNQAVFCVTPISRANWQDEILFRLDVTSQIAANHLRSPKRLSSKDRPFANREIPLAICTPEAVIAFQLIRLPGRAAQWTNNAHRPTQLNKMIYTCFLIEESIKQFYEALIFFVFHTTDISIYLVVSNI